MKQLFRILLLFVLISGALVACTANKKCDGTRAIHTPMGKM